MARSSFRFRLQRLLDVREMREKQAQQELQARRAQVVVEQQKLERMRGEEQDLRTEQAQPYRSGDDLNRFAQKRTWLEQAITEKVREQRAQEGAIAAAQARVAEQVEVVKQRGIEVKALEKLEEKQREEHRLDQLREEGLFLDDLAGQGFIRRRTLAKQRAEADAVAAAEAERGGD